MSASTKRDRPPTNCFRGRLSGGRPAKIFHASTSARKQLDDFDQLGRIRCGMDFNPGVDSRRMSCTQCLDVLGDTGRGAGLPLFAELFRVKADQARAGFPARDFGAKMSKSATLLKAAQPLPLEPAGGIAPGLEGLSRQPSRLFRLIRVGPGANHDRADRPQFSSRRA